ncbi:MAG: hypothetical protein U1E97_07845 [Alphaproteobacteria bacterium]
MAWRDDQQQSGKLAGKRLVRGGDDIILAVMGTGGKPDRPRADGLGQRLARGRVAERALASNFRLPAT